MLYELQDDVLRAARFAQMMHPSSETLAQRGVPEGAFAWRLFSDVVRH